MELCEKVTKDGRYLLGISGGSDSMALLSLCIRAGLDLVVCHVNYKMRISSDGEEDLVRECCFENDIPFEVLYPEQKEKGNFQSWAREARYEFYKKIYDSYGCTALLLGHQKDDSIETYLMSKERGSHGWYYGIPEETFHHGMRIIRPLLKYRKKELRQYCLDNEITFHDDESNFTDKYHRNRIRHQQVETATDQQIEDWAREIEELNESQDRLLKDFEGRFAGREEIEISELADDEKRDDLLRWFIWQYDRGYNYSSAQIREMNNTIINSGHNGYLLLHGGYELVFEYGHFYIWKPGRKYSYQLEEPQEIITPFFHTAFTGRTIEGLSLTEDDYPITIRPYESEDSILLRFGTKKVSRFLIDRKIPRKERYYWPVVANRKGEVIFVCGVGCDVAHYTVNADLFVIK